MLAKVKINYFTLSHFLSYELFTSVLNVCLSAAEVTHRDLQ